MQFILTRFIIKNPNKHYLASHISYFSFGFIFSLILLWAGYNINKENEKHPFDDLSDWAKGKESYDPLDPKIIKALGTRKQN